MIFSSLVFLFCFLPILLGVYYLSPRGARNYILLFFSLLFYAWGGVSYSLLLIGSILVNYFLARIIEKKEKNKPWLIGGLIFNVFLIGVFKYFDFFIENTNSIMQLIDPKAEPFPLAHIVLPVGISFFTFQQMSLLWDVFRDKDNNHSTGLLNSALYISFFPQLIAGPIVRYHDIIDQIQQRRESVNLFSSGVQRFSLGLFKKVIVANSCASIVDGVLNDGSMMVTTSVAWLVIICYAFQIYFDFSGYSDMAIGLARMFGFRLLENFNFPYISTSIKDFWRRWHISLSTWFRDYVYIPLGGSRKSAKRTYWNLLIVFLLTGFWHGSTWSFVFWGVFHGAFLILERLGFDKVLKANPKPISWAYTMLIVLIGWVFFRIENFSEAWNFTLKLFGIGLSNQIGFLNYLSTENIVIIILAALSSSTLFLKLKDLLEEKIEGRKLIFLQMGRSGFVWFIIFYCTMYINSGSYNPFIYFRF